MASIFAQTSLAPGQCIHKLPTRCGLTALPTCCACQDIRPHSSMYRKYVDGVGFTWGGTRQEQYCWMCKVFWDARIAAAHMRPSETRLPDVPNQQRFLELWYTWYRSYEEGGHNNGTEERRALIGERLEDISPGHLPRSLHELERGSPVEPNEVNIPFSAPADTGIEEAGQDDNGSEGPLFDPPTPELANEPFHGSFGPRPGQRTNLTYRTFEDRRPSGLEIAALREDLTHIKRATERVIMGIRSLDENEEDAWNTTNNGNALNDCLEDLTRRIDRHSDIEQAAMATTTEQPPHSSPVSDPRLAGPAFTWDACRERTYFVENLIPHVFLVSGSPEDCLYFADNELSRAQEENDIALRYYNAVNTRLRLTRTQRNRFFQEAEQNRLRQQSHQSSNQQPQADGSLGRHTQPANSQGLSREQEGADQALAAASNGYSLIPLWGNQGNRLPGPSQQGQVDDTEGIALSNLVERAESLLSSIESENGPQHQLRAMYARIRERHVESEALLPHGKGLDRADGRPQAMDDTDMLVRMECKICFSQVATIAVLPCGHCMMCKWCADQAIPTRDSDRTRPVVPTNCPLCRRRVKQRVAIFV